uniref:Ion transport domain-containing protein n=1 Tax=Panagrolaimus sp. JU765 TaxID=591449 RepID=A0AC34R189_9BILA
MCRPFSLTTSVLSYGNKTETGKPNQEGSYLYHSIDVYWHYENLTIQEREGNDQWMMVNNSYPFPACDAENFSNGEVNGMYYRAYKFENEGYHSRRCHLTQYFNQGFQGYVRLISEAFIVVTVFGHLILIAILVPVRYCCFFGDIMILFDNMISIIVVILTALHTLFYLRAIKFVGPFVVMIYTILLKDITIFIMIYTIFLMGFFMSFYLLFISCERIKGDLGASNILASPFEAMIRLFIMTLNEFQTFYSELNACGDQQMATLGKIIFLIYEVAVSLTQFNLLIAMLTRTYEEIYATQKEYKRQWAQVILMQELSLPPKDRLMALLKYSRPIGTNKKKRAFVVTRKTDFESLSESEKLMKEEQLNAIREERRMLLKRRLRELNGGKDGMKTSLRPGTSYRGHAPMMPTQWHYLA